MEDAQTFLFHVCEVGEGFADGLKHGVSVLSHAPQCAVPGAPMKAEVEADSTIRCSCRFLGATVAAGGRRTSCSPRVWRFRESALRRTSHRESMEEPLVTGNVVETRTPGCPRDGRTS